MEPVAAHAVAGVEVIRQRIHVGVLGNALVEGRVEYRHLHRAGEELARYINAGEVPGVVQGGERHVVLDGRPHLLVDHHRVTVGLAAVHHTVAHPRDVGHVVDDSVPGILQGFHDQGHALLVVAHPLLLADLALVAGSGDDMLEAAGGLADALQQAGAEHLLVRVELEDLVLDGGTAGVDDENLHACLSAWAWMAVMITVLTISVTVQPRLRSFTGLRMPCMMGPMATALALRCTAL